MKWLEGYPREFKLFLVASLVNSTGASMMWPLITMFVFKVLGKTMTDAGFVLLIHSTGWIAGQILGGALYHRVGVKKLIVGSLAMNALSLLSLPIVASNWNYFIVLMLVAGFANALSMPAIQAFVGFRFTERRAEMFNIIYVVNNIGVAVGTALSGVLVRISYDLSFVLNGVASLSFAIFFFIYLTKVELEQGNLNIEKRKKVTEGKSVSVLLKDYRLYLFLAGGSLFQWLANCIWNNGVSPYTISMGMPEWRYSILWTLNGVLIFVAQPLVNGIRRWCAETPQRQMVVSGIFYLLGYISILAFHTYTSMMTGMVLATIGEMLISPAIPSFISERSGKSAPFYLGLVGGIGSAGRVFGPYTMGVLYDKGGLLPVAWLSVAVAIMSIAAYLVHSMLNPMNQPTKEITGGKDASFS